VAYLSPVGFFDCVENYWYQFHEQKGATTTFI
jgi:hypothetical protein